MLIGFINPNKEIKEPALHLGLAYIASYLLNKFNFIKILVLDTRVATKKETSEFFNHKFDVLAYTSTSQTYTEALEIAKDQQQKNPSLIQIIGGAHPSTVLGEVLENTPFRYAVCGEGEQTFAELIECLYKKESPENIAGLIYRNLSGEIIENPRRIVFQNLDEIPFPAWHLFPMKRYPQHRIITSRGCPYNCVFCNTHAIWSHKWRKRSPQNIVAELKILINEFGFKSFAFNDDSFNVDIQRAEDVCDLIATELPDIIWSSSVRIDRITPVLAEKMKKSGCYNVSIGIESVNNEILHAMKKNITKEKIEQGIDLLINQKIDVMGQFMIGNPGDTLETVTESIEFAKNSKLTGIEFYTALPYKQSELLDYVLSKGKLLTDKPVYEYHTISPRIIYETPEFLYADRLKAIELARTNGFYHALSTDKRNYLLDIGKSFAKIIQQLLKGKTGNAIYLKFRNIYHAVFK